MGLVFELGLEQVGWWFFFKSHVKWAGLLVKRKRKKKRKRGKIGKVQHAGEREREKGTVHKLGHLPEF